MFSKKEIIINKISNNNITNNNSNNSSISIKKKMLHLDSLIYLKSLTNLEVCFLAKKKKITIKKVQVRKIHMLSNKIDLVIHILKKNNNNKGSNNNIRILKISISNRMKSSFHIPIWMKSRSGISLMIKKHLMLIYYSLMVTMMPMKITNNFSKNRNKDHKNMMDMQELTSLMTIHIIIKAVTTIILLKIKQIKINLQVIRIYLI